MIGGIHRIDLGANCYLIDVASGFVLVDTGLPGKQAALDAELAAAGCGPSDLRLVILTHGDVDHVGNCAHLRKTHHVPIAIHVGDAEAVRSGNMSASRKAEPDRVASLFKVITRVAGLLGKISGRGPAFEVFEPDMLVEDGQDLSAWGLDARVVGLPGHSNGSIGVLTRDGDLFCGDLLANLRKPALHFLIDDLPKARESVAKLRGLGVETVYPGHGKPFPLKQLSIDEDPVGSAGSRA